MRHLANPEEWGPHTTQASKHRGIEACEPEYMVDISVTANPPNADADDPFGYEFLTLAMEVEWSSNQNERRYDFCKLVDIRASRKLFIGACGAAQWRAIDLELDAMQSFLDAHRLVDDDEEFGVIICSYGAGEESGGWVLRKNNGRREVRVTKSE